MHIYLRYIYYVLIRRTHEWRWSVISLSETIVTFFHAITLVFRCEGAVFKWKSNCWKKKKRIQRRAPSSSICVVISQTGTKTLADAQLPIWFRLYVSVPYLAFIDVQNRIVFLSLRQQKYPLRLSPREREYGSADQSTETLKPVVRQRWEVGRQMPGILSAPN